MVLYGVECNPRYPQATNGKLPKNPSNLTVSSALSIEDFKLYSLRLFFVGAKPSIVVQ